MKEQLQHRLIPTYFNEFQCIGGACEDTCCAGWRIDIDQKTFKQYKKEKNIEIKNSLSKNIKRNRTEDATPHNYGQFKMDENNSCSMLTSDGLCSIQQTLGANSLCRTCSTYPREITTINNIFEKTLTLSCPEAARIILNRPGGIDFIEEEGIEIYPASNHFTHSNEENSVFWQIRIFMIDTLQHKNHTYETKLLIISMFLEDYVSLNSINTVTVEPLIQKYANCLNLDNLDVMFKDIPLHYEKQINLSLSILNHPFPEEFNTLINKVKNSLKIHEKSSILLKEYQSALKEVYHPFSTKFGFVLENYLVNACFDKIKHASPNYLIKQFTNICVDYVVLRFLLSGFAYKDTTLSMEQVIYIIQKYNKSLSHTTTYKEEITRILQNPSTSILEQITLMIHI